jgi:hypothetical protein
MQSPAPFVEFARQLIYVHGSRAEAEAAQHATICARMGDAQTARMWHRVEAVIESLRPASLN